jgi:hypothetical protein
MPHLWKAGPGGEDTAIASQLSSKKEDFLEREFFGSFSWKFLA